MIKYRKFEVFKEVMDTGTVTAAAKRLHVSQPAISKMIADFEDDVGYELFTRVKGRLVPTTEAHLLLEEVNRSFKGINYLVEYARELKDYRSGQLDIGVLPALSNQWIAAYIASVIEAKGEISISIKATSSLQIIRYAKSQQIDFGLSLVPIEDPAVHCEAIATLRGVCIVPADHPLQERDTIIAADLNNKPFIALSVHDKTKIKVDTLLSASGVAPSQVIQAGLSTTACNLVAQGLGVAIVDEVSASEHAHLGYSVHPFEPAIDFPVYLVKSSTGRVSRLSNEGIELLKEFARQRLPLR
jgi:DNA-binding transcriptional LysR family regulator